MDVQMPDGTVIQDVPDGVTKAQLAQKYQAHLAGPTMSAGDVASGAAKNIIPSAINFGKEVAQPFLHPLDTLNSLDQLGGALTSKAIGGLGLQHAIGQSNEQKANDEAPADAIGKFYADRYGGMENIKHTLATDPIGLMADASVPLTLGASALERAPSAVGKAAMLAGKAGEVANPASAVLAGVKYPAKLAGKLLSEGLGVTTGAGGQSVRAAYGAGLKGGTAADAFAGNMRGDIPIENIVTDAKKGLSNLEQQRGAEYRAGMGAVNADPTVLSMGPVDAAVTKAASINNFEGVDLAPSTAATRQKIATLLEEWQTNPNDKFRTAAGLDALKKAIGDVKDTTDYGTPERAIADNAYNAVRGEVANQAPTYAATMKDYATASDRLNELRGTFSLGEGKMRDTAIRKLQSSLRDNVNTSFGRRTALAQELANAGAPNLMESIAGQTLTSSTPRGLGKLLASGEIGGSIPLALMGHPGVAAAMLPALAAQSPRLVGETALATGKAARLAKSLLPKRTQAANAALLAEELGLQTQGSN